MSRKRNKKNKIKKIRHTELDICLLSCGLVEPQVFNDCLSAIVRESEQFQSQIYVYLNGAPVEDKAKFIDMVNTYPQIKLKQSSERVGFSAGANRVIKHGASPLFLFITDDVILHPGSLKTLVDRVRSDEKIGICGMKLTFPEDSITQQRPAGRVQHIGHGIDIRGKVTHPLMGWKPDNPKCNVSRQVLSVTGGVFLARRNAFLKVGGFWEGYGLGYYEDVELCLQVGRIGYKIWVDTEATATHYTNMSMEKSEIRPSIQVNEMLFMERNQGLLVNDNWTFW